MPGRTVFRTKVENVFLQFVSQSAEFDTDDCGRGDQAHAGKAENWEYRTFSVSLSELTVRWEFG